jgi:hypothetical protein
MYICRDMRNERGTGQKLIPIPANEKFIKELNDGFRKAGYSNRSQFIRDAIVEKLSRMGIEIPREFAVAPDRIGKGGRQSAPPAKSTGKKTGAKGAAAKSARKSSRR